MLIAEITQPSEVYVSGDQGAPGCVVVPPFYVNILEKVGVLSVARHTLNYSLNSYKTIGSEPKRWRARGDLNPRSPAPQASVLIRARLRALSHG